MFRWTEELVIEESKKYVSRNEFARKRSAAYKFARVNGLLDKMVWLKKPTPKRSHINDYCVYSYVDEENKVAYVGLTHCKRKRHYEHITNYNGDSAVYEYFSFINKPIPNPIYLIDELFWNEALIEEDNYVNIYQGNGYTTLNKSKTGLKSGSLGGNVIKWDINSVIEESKKYTTKTEFYKNNISAYRVARENNLFDFMPWLISENTPNGFWTKERVIKESKKYKTYSEFLKNSKGASQAANRGGYLTELVWLEKQYTPKGYWTEEKLLEESKKYSSKKEFRENNRNAYRKVTKDLFDKMIWLK